MLYIVGMACEHAFGRLRTLAVLAACGLAGSAASVLANPGPSVGASGAVFGVAAAVIAFLRRHRASFFVRDARIGVVLLAWALYQIALGFTDPFTDNYAHLGGFAAGAVLGLVLKPNLLAPPPGR